MPITEADLDELLTKKEAADLLHVHIATIDRMIAAHKIDIVRIGSGNGRVRITRRAILDHLNRGVVPAAKARKRSA